MQEREIAAMCGPVDENPLAGAGITSGGGFSIYNPRPAYQKAAVDSYLKQGGVFPSEGDGNRVLSRDGHLYFNKSNRAYPDVAALGHNFMVFQKSINGFSWHSLDGTSASTPVFGGIVALLNDIRLEKGLKPLGFLNPWLYHLADKSQSAFFDVTVGNNACGTSSHKCCTYNISSPGDGETNITKPLGYHATNGFDPVTGLGTPNFEEMRRAVELKANEQIKKISDSELDNKLHELQNSVDNLTTGIIILSAAIAVLIILIVLCQFFVVRRGKQQNSVPPLPHHERQLATELTPREESARH